MERVYNRRSKRLALQVRVRVYGHGKGRAFREESHTLNVNAHGALLAMHTPVELGQALVLMNGMTGEEQECRVAYVGRLSAGQAKVGVAFKHPAPHFWHIDFPQLDPADHERLVTRRPAFAMAR